MRRALFAIGLGGFLGAAGCHVYRGSTGRDPFVGQNDPLGAAVLAGSAVAATGVNRAVTHGCYSSCPYGTSCNHDTGMCEKLTCACRADLVCERIGGENVCVGRKAPDKASDGGADGSAAAEISDAAARD